MSDDSKQCQKITMVEGNQTEIDTTDCPPALPQTASATSGLSTPSTNSTFKTSLPATPTWTIPSASGSLLPGNISGEKRLDSGAVAGVAVGMLIVGILIAGVVFFVLLRRQKKKQASSYHLAHVASRQYPSSTEKTPVMVTSAPMSNFNDLLPQPVADDNITDELSKIRDNIKNHVRTYYHSSPISAAQLDERAMESFAIATGLATTVIANALANTEQRPNAIRSIVAWAILSKVTGERMPSLLPADIAALAASLAAKSDTNTSQATLYSKWKTITGKLLEQRSNKSPQNSERNQSFSNTIAEIDSILAPTVQGSVDGGQRRQNLNMILARSAKFASLLFSQPGSFQFDFVSERGSLVAFPALLQTIGDQGQTLRPPRMLSSKEIST